MTNSPEPSQDLTTLDRLRARLERQPINAGAELHRGRGVTFTVDDDDQLQASTTFVTLCAGETIPAGTPIQIDELGLLRPASPPESPSRAALEALLAGFQAQAHELDLRVDDAIVARDAANEDVILLETTLADLARLEARPKTLIEVADSRTTADSILSELNDRAARR